MRNTVRDRREKAGLSQAELGQRLGVSRQTVSSIEHGRYDPSLPLAIRIAVLFNTTVEEVFFLDEHKPAASHS